MRELLPAVRYKAKEDINNLSSLSRLLDLMDFLPFTGDKEDDEKVNK